MQWIKKEFAAESVKDYKYKIEYGKRKSIQISVIPDDPPYVFVKAPIKSSKAIVLKELRTHDKWIRKRLMEVERNLQEAHDQGILSDMELSVLRKEAKEYIPKRVAYYAEKMGVTYNRIYIRTQNTRWGSCSAKGNLNFNCLLMLMPFEVIDSVVVHELAHRIHMNHSKAFYDVVYTYFPDYQKQNTWLKKHGKAILLRIRNVKQTSE